MKATPSTGSASQPQANSPSAAIVAEAATVFHTVDARGRRIGFRKPSARDRYRVSKMLGGEVATNQEAAGMAMLAFLCTEIDGNPVVPANSERQIEALIDRLDNDGINAIGLGLSEQLGIVADEDMSDKDAVKN